ncbi:MAG: alpha-L-fucosidase [Lachnospiraceae bacterium]|nr:alpha-L-fucosidase [Lachnospiraceae bacterium]
MSVEANLNLLPEEINTLDRRLIKIIPSRRQLRFQQTEFYAFIHFSVNTYTGKEWGDGTEPESIFMPDKFDAAQWVESVKAAGMKGLILTCKHHDGFCLWPSRYTEHTIAGSPFRNGNGDIVKEVSEACRKGGIRFGIYLSPWDQHNESYGQGDAYNDFFVNQLTELLSNYGEIFSVWFDGACGEGKNGKKQDYDWERYYEVIRRLQPDACISVCGPDIRWCGNEAGHTRPAEWSVVSARLCNNEKVAADSQQTDDIQFRQRNFRSGDLDLGSRKVLAAEQDLIWYPAEVNTSIRPGWFYHEEEDDKVRPLEELLHIYYHSVGGNAMFLLNIPPAKNGLFHENDVRRLKEIGASLRKTFSRNLLDEAIIEADQWENGYAVEHVRKDDLESFFKTPDGIRTAELTIRFPKPEKVSHVVLKENISFSQRIEAFEIRDAEGSLLYKGSTVGYKKIAVFAETETEALHIRICDARVCPTLSFIGVY